MKNKKILIGIVMCLAIFVLAKINCNITNVYGASNTEYVSGIFKYKVLDDGTAAITGLSGTLTDSNLVIPEKIAGYRVSRIGRKAFYANNNITSLKLNEGLEVIEQGAFSYCTNISGDLELPSSLKVIDGNLYNAKEGTFRNTAIKNLIIKGGNTDLTIGDDAFLECKNMLSANIPSRVTSIGYGAFQNATYLEKVTFEDGSKVLNIGQSAFKETGIKDLVLSNQVCNIERDAFRSCTSLKSVKFGSNLRKIGIATFYGCVNLTGDIVIPSKVELIGGGNEGAFQYTRVTSVVIEDGNPGITIGGYAFANNSFLKYVKLSNRVTRIGSGAFKNDTSMAYAQIKDGYYEMQIDDSAFANCTFLKAVSLPKIVKSISYYAFEGCRKFKDVYYAGTRDDYSRVRYTGNKRNEILNATFHYSSNGPSEWPSIIFTGWRLENGNLYWIEDDVKQGTTGRGKEIYDPDSDGWYWLDAVDGGKMAVSKDVYQESDAGIWGDKVDSNGNRTGKWVRYNDKGRMVKGWSSYDGKRYYFDPIYGTMAKGYATVDNSEYYFDKYTGACNGTVCTPVQFGWKEINGRQYWFENYIRQGYSVDSTYRGKEIYDPSTDAWYWLDNVNDGAKAVSKDVYQESLAGQWGDIVGADGQRYGKWVRYDSNGHMIKGWNSNDNGTYYFDPVYGTMAKGYANIDGEDHYFNELNGVLEW